ncbi:MAG: methylmalonyl Co-A mutase-associated GTPase MeaB [Bacillota bacterium]|jgi:LAO/AO transport system kinase
MSRNRLPWEEGFLSGDVRSLARAITQVENQPETVYGFLGDVAERLGKAHIIGITGPPGAGKSTLTGRLAAEFAARGFSLGLLLVDPSSPFTGGAILGDRLRLPDIAGKPGVYVRSMSSRGSMGGLSRATGDAVKLLDAFGKDIIIVETVGTGQSETDVISVVDSVVVISVPGLGDDIQAMKAGILEIADLFVVNKADREGADRTERELRSMLRLQPQKDGWEIPVLRTVATTHEGVPELVDKLLEHRLFLEDSGQIVDRRLRRVQRELDQLLSARLTRQLQQLLGEDVLAAAARRVALGQQTVYQMAEELWQTLVAGLAR